MTAGPDETRNDAAGEPSHDSPADDLSIVPGFEPGRPAAGEPGPDPEREASAPPAGRLDPALDPDRYDPHADDPTLTGLLGERAHEDTRDTYQWAFGLLGIVVFIALVAWLFGSVLSA